MQLQEIDIKTDKEAQQLFQKLVKQLVMFCDKRGFNNPYIESDANESKTNRRFKFTFERVDLDETT
jgi:hypothetical protein